MRSTLSIILVLILMLSACGTGHRLDDTDDGGGLYLPTVNVVDSGTMLLASGVFQGGGNDLVIADMPSRTKIRVPDQTAIFANNPIYDTDNDGDIDYIILSLRPLSAHAAGCTAALKNGSYVPVAEFDKVGGAGFEPHDASFSPRTELTLGVSDASLESPGQTLDLYKFDPDYVPVHLPAADVGTDTGVWNFVQTVTIFLDDGVTAAAFDATRFGEYCVVTDVVHDQGAAASL